MTGGVDWVAVALLYPIAGAAICGLFTAVIDDLDRIPAGGGPAFAFLVGMFWPLAIVGGVAYGTWRASVLVARSFAALWRAWRPRRVPRAVARDRGAR